MSERTIITTVEVTNVYKNLPECLELDKEAWGNIVKKDIESAIGADCVVVTKVQEFVRKGCVE